MTKEKKLIKNTAIYAVGNIGSKVLSYLMVLIYSHYITGQELGYYDLIITTVSMLQPIVILQFTDGVYRLLVNECNDKKRKSIIATASKFIMVTLSVSEVLFIAFAYVFHLKYVFAICVYSVSLTIFFLFHEVIRGLGETKKYALVGLLYSAVMFVLELILLIVYNMGILALLYSNSISMLICTVVMFFSQPELRGSLNSIFDRSIFTDLLKYSAPLVPNTISWWVVSSSDRYIILFFLGASFNGVYSISNKFPTILTTITGIFYLAWQETAIKEYNSDNRDIFFSNIFEKYSRLLYGLTLCAIPATQIVISVFVGDEYKNAWMYTGFLYLGAVFSALSSFLGLGYQISKETKRSMSTTIFAAAINILVNILLIEKIGLQAASFSTFISYLFLFLVRIRHCRRYFELKVNWTFFWLMLLATLIMIYVVWAFDNLLVSLLLCLFAFIFFLMINKYILNLFFGRFKR